MSGPPPKKDSQRRRANKPKSYGAAEAEVAGVGVQAPDLGLNECHPMVVDLYDSLAVSVEGRYFSPSDWQRARLECFYLDKLLSSGRAPGSQAWAAVQAGLAALLVSPAEKRRLGIELEQAVADPDDAAADETVNVLFGKFGTS